MGDALFDLEQVLRSRKEKLTIQESNIFLAWRARAMRDFTVGFGGGSIVTWLATQRLSSSFRYQVVLGAAGACGLLKLGKSVENSIDRVLSLEGSRVQQELANIMLKKYNYDPWVLQRHPKHFYSEKVYEESTGDEPAFRWRFKNFSGDPVDYSQSEASSTEKIIAKKNEVKKAQDEISQSNVIAGSATSVDPFDIMFDIPRSAESNTTDEPPSTVSPRESRKKRRSRRRHRRHHHEDSDV